MSAEPVELDLQIEQAAERTLLAWIRTALAVMGLGFVVARFGLFLREMAQVGKRPEPPSSDFSLYVGVGLVGVGVLALAGSAVRFVRFLRRVRAGEPAPLTIGPGIALAIGLALAGVAMAFYLMVPSR
ncbi:DUF202 domain-containing protein [bacterium]|nr:MAG: DUF202 domain-containing protein [bacterium]